MRVAHALTDKAMRSPVVSRLGVAMVVLIGGCAPPGGVSTVLAETADTVAEVDKIPAICIEAEAAALDPGAWAEVLGAIEKAIDPRRTAQDGRSASEWCREDTLRCSPWLRGCHSDWHLVPVPLPAVARRH